MGNSKLMLNQCILIMGISGSGKTTTGKLLANKIGGDFLDADDLHPRCNIQKIKNGYSLTDQDRAPWLEEIISAITNHHRQQILVIACSALKKILSGKNRSAKLYPRLLRWF